LVEKEKRACELLATCSGQRETKNEHAACTAGTENAEQEKSTQENAGSALLSGR
jgi:hypothetical protein